MWTRRNYFSNGVEVNKDDYFLLPGSSGYFEMLHELGHAFGLTRHSPDLDILDLAQRYGWK